jgi:hypothetical protein
MSSERLVPGIMVLLPIPAFVVPALALRWLLELPGLQQGRLVENDAALSVIVPVLLWTVVPAAALGVWSALAGHEDAGLWPALALLPLAALVAVAVAVICSAGPHGASLALLVPAGQAAVAAGAVLGWGSVRLRPLAGCTVVLVAACWLGQGIQAALTHWLVPDVVVAVDGTLTRAARDAAGRLTLWEPVGRVAAAAVAVLAGVLVARRHGSPAGGIGRRAFVSLAYAVIPALAIVVVAALTFVALGPAGQRQLDGIEWTLLGAFLGYLTAVAVPGSPDR